MEETFAFRKSAANEVEVTKTIVVKMTKAQLLQELVTIDTNLAQHAQSIEQLTARKADIEAALSELGV